MSSARVVCRCCRRRAVWVEAAFDDFDLDVGGRWMLADEAIASPWHRDTFTPHPVDPVRATV